VPLDRVRLTAAKSGLGRHRKLRLARPQGSDSGSAPEDDELRLARPQGSDSGSAPEDDELRLARPQGSNSASAPDDGLRLARPGARTRPRPRKTDSTSTSEEPLPRPTQGSDRPHHRGGIITVTEPPKKLGPPTVVLVQRTSNNPVGAPELLDKFGICFLTSPGTFHPSCRHYRTSEIKKCGSDYITYIYLKSKIRLFITDQKYKRVQSSIIT
jgi:hypothetical protein